MADANIKVDPKQLKNYSNNIKTGYKKTCTAIFRKQNSGENLKSTWTGSGSVH